MIRKKYDSVLIFCFYLTFTASCTSESGSDYSYSANSLPFNSISLDDLSDFRKNMTDGWKIAGNAFADRKKHHHMEVNDGTGILTLQPGEEEESRLSTNFEHGDLDLKLDFMLGKGSASAILLQGRYEVRLADSWQKDELSPEDCGGIYNVPKSGTFQGKAPDANATKAPGLWQHLEVSFKAARFNESGEKITDARFEKITLNGKVVQKDVTIDAPGRTSPFGDEHYKEPIVIRAVQGPVAFRNIRYKKYDDQRIGLEDVHFKAFEGRFMNYDTLKHLTPVRTGPADSLTFENAVKDGLIEYKGKMQVPESGEYLFRLSTGGASWLYLDSEFFMDNDESRDYEFSTYAKKYLEKGEHTFRLIYLNTDHSLVLHYEGPNMPWTPLNKASSVRRRAGAEPMYHYAEDKPVLLRSFFMHKDRKMLHTLSLGLPEGLNYAYSLRNYAPLTVWRDNFANVAQMWRFRGREQTLEPLGVRAELHGKPTVAFLNDKNEAWPDTVSIDFFTDRIYRLNDSGLPVFSYRLDNIWIRDHLTPTEDKSGLRRELSLDFSGTDRADDKDLYILLASTPLIEKLTNGNYTVNNKNYYIEDIQTSGGSPYIRESKGQQQLILPVTARQDDYGVSYAIVW